jgi:hypothetical protein
MPELQEMVKELLKKSIDSVEGRSKIGGKGNLATLLNTEGKWQEALNTYQECPEFFRSIDAKSQMASVNLVLDNENRRVT